MNIEQIQSIDTDDKFDRLFDLAEAYDDSTALANFKRNMEALPARPNFGDYRDLEEPYSKVYPDSGAFTKSRLEPYSEPGLFGKFRNVLHKNGPVMSALSPLFGLQYKDPEDAPRNIAGAVTEITGHPMAGEAADVVTQFIPGVAAINAYDNGRIPGILDFTGAMNPLKWSKAEKVMTAIGGLGDLARRWLDSIPKRDNK